LRFVCTFVLPAQEYRSTITGPITDPTGAGVPNVKVTALKVGTNSKFPTVSGSEGFYTIPQLPPGTYQLTAEISGFKTYVQYGIELAAKVRVAVDIPWRSGRLVRASPSHGTYLR
jgi:hypothetical protein